MSTKQAALRTPKCLINFPKLIKPELRKGAKEGDRPKYSALLVFNKEAQATKEFKAIEAAVNALISEKYKNGAPKSFKFPFKKGEDMTKDDGTRISGCNDGDLCLRVASTFAPTVLDQAKNEVTDENVVYSGSYVMAMITPNLYDVDGGKGINFYLGNVLKVAEGERLGGGRRSAKSDFEDVEEIEIESADDIEF